MEQVQAIHENGAFSIALIGHITSANAAAVEEEIMALAEQNTAETLTLDAEKLQYISSAGLRILLRLLKARRNPRLVNVSSEVYEVLDTTGFTEMMDVQKAYRRLSVEGCEIIGQGSNGVVYRLDAETIVKTYRNPDALPDMQREREIARKAFILGVPTAIPYDIVRVDDKYGAVFELLNATSISKLIMREPENFDHHVDTFVQMLRLIHDTPVKKGELPDAKAVALDWADFLKGHIPDNQQQKLHDMIAAVPEHNFMLHGDYHTNNVMVQNGEALLIDMDTLCVGHPVFELASTFNAFVGFGEVNHEITAKFLGVPYEITGKIWQATLRRYLEGRSEEEVQAIADKCALMGYTRLLRRSIRREKEMPLGKQRIAACKMHIAELLERVDSLEF